MRTIKKRLAMLENGAIDCMVQRLFFGGKLLRESATFERHLHCPSLLGDRATIGETRLQRHFVVQVILHEQPMAMPGAMLTTGQQAPASDPRTPVESTHVAAVQETN